MIVKYALAGLVLLGGVNTYAQQEGSISTQTEVVDAKTPEEKAAEMTAEMTEALALTTEQVEKVSMLNLKVANKIDVIINDDSMDNAKKKEFIAGNKADHKNVMTTILTGDQMATYEAWMAKKKASQNKDVKVTE